MDGVELSQMRRVPEPAPEAPRYPQVKPLLIGLTLGIVIAIALMLWYTQLPTAVTIHQSDGKPFAFAEGIVSTGMGTAYTKCGDKIYFLNQDGAKEVVIK